VADQLVTPEELASYLQQDLDASTANLLIDLATGIVQSTVGQRLVEATTTALLDVTEPDSWLELPQRPVQSVAAVALNGDPVTDWVLRNQRLWRAAGWLANSWEPSQVEVTWTHGYPAGDRYLEMARLVTLSLAGSAYPNPGAVKSESIDDYRVSFDDAVARMQLTEPARLALINAYGISAYVTVSR